MIEDWESIGDWYAQLVRGGSAMHRFSRDILLETLPANLFGVDVLDVGCGEGIVSRSLAHRGARVLGIDPALTLISHAQAEERARPIGVTYRLDDGATLQTVADSSMDGVTAGLSLNNIPDLDAALESIRRVLRPGGFVAFTVPHPCFDAPSTATVSTESGNRRVVGNYFAEGFWRSSHPKSVRRVGNYHRTVSTYLMKVIGHGFTLDAYREPRPCQEVRIEAPHRPDLPPFLLVGAIRSS